MKFLILTALVFSIFAISLGTMVPEAAASDNLYVSAEYATFENHFGKDQIVEVIVSNSPQSEPSVLIDSNYKLRMALAQDGKWYGYFGDQVRIQKLDSQVISPGIGMDFGEFCANTTPQSVLGIDISKTKGVAIPYSYNGTGSSTNGGTLSQICQGGSFDSNRVSNVLLNSPTLVTAPTLGNIGLQNNVWPFIQLIDMSSQDITIVLEQPGLDESVELSYDPRKNTFNSPIKNHIFVLNPITVDEAENFRGNAIVCFNDEQLKQLLNYEFRFYFTTNLGLNFSIDQQKYNDNKGCVVITSADFSGVVEYTVRVGHRNMESYTLPEKFKLVILPVNDAPIMTSATASNSVNEDSTVSMKLDGTDIDGDSLKYVFTTNPSNGKISGTSLNITYTPNPNFNGQDVFAYNVNDGFLDSSEQKITITVNPVNDIPIAKAGTDQSVDVNSIVSLDGSSSDIDADAITYSWIQTAGYPVTLTSSTILNPKFTAPTTNGQLTFMLTVSDGKATSNPAVVSVFVGSTVPVPVPPPSPTKIVATPANGAINLKWSPPAKDGGSPIIDYVIEYKSAADTSWKTFADGKSTNTQTTITGLKNDVKYQFVISAVNSVGSGEKSTPSNAIPKSITPPPAPDPKVLADEKKAAEKKALEEKKAADKKAADKKAAEKKAADKKAAEKKAADKKAADAKKAAPKK